jgi:hypothetical protein
MIGQTVGKYRIVSRLGRGGMGTVYKAIDETLEREVAIKVLNPDLADSDLLKRFRAEAVTLARLNHPNIATLFELGRQGDELLMVMEFVRGETFDKLSDRVGPMPFERAAYLCTQVLDALSHAHRAGIVHRDLKPSNLMLAESGVVKVMDFGIARMVGTEHLTTDGYMMGTPAYMAPEQVMGSEVDGRADLYSIGVVLFRLLTGSLPFKADTAVAMIQKQIKDAPTPLRQFRAELPVWCEQILDRALAKPPENRYQTAAEFRGALAVSVAIAPVGEVSEVLAGPASAAAHSRTVVNDDPEMTVPPDSMLTPLARRNVPEDDPFDADVTQPATPVGTAERLRLDAEAADVTQAFNPADTSAQPYQPLVVVGAAEPAIAQGLISDVAVSSPADTAAVRTPNGEKTVVLRKSHVAAGGALAAVVLAGVVLLAVFMLRRTTPPAPPPPTAESALPAPPVAASSLSAETPAAETPPVELPVPPALAPVPNAKATSPIRGTAKPAPPAPPAPTPPSASSGAPASGEPVAPVSAGAGHPPLAVLPPVVFTPLKLVVFTSGKARERDVTVRLGEQDVAVTERSAGASLATVPYNTVVGLFYSRSPEPRWTGPTGIVIPVAKVDRGRFGFLRGDRDWLTIRTPTEFTALRPESSHLARLIEALEARTGLKVVRVTGRPAKD